MPKPLFGDNGSGMHVHQSIFNGDSPLFYEKGAYANLSEMAMHYIGGILHHAPALIALTNPSTNSFKRLVPGYEAPVNLVFSKGNRSAAIRIPVAAVTPKGCRIEFRTPDSTANPYLAFAAMLIAGLDGIKRKLDPVLLDMVLLIKTSTNCQKKRRKKSAGSRYTWTKRLTLWKQTTSS